MRYHCLRDCADWRSENLRMSTASDEACKLYDISLTQIIKWTDCAEFGGLEASMNKMLEADFNFVMGHVLRAGIQLVGSSNPSALSDEIRQMNSLADKQAKSLTSREKEHASAVTDLYNGELIQACVKWEKILVDYPTDLLAMKFLHDTYFYLGYHRPMRDSIGRALPHWKSSMPLYSYVQGMYSFGLVQSNYFDEAYQSARLALDMDKEDAWAVHTIAHYYEYKNDANAGIKFLKEAESNWNVANYLMGHNYWHLAVYNIENDNHDEALRIFDTISNKSETLDMVDLASMLFRLKLDSCSRDLSKNWLHLKEQFSARVNYHGYTFNDVHVLMMLSACNDTENLESFFSSFKSYISEDNTKSFLKSVNQELGSALFDSICHFDREEFGQVVELLYPRKYDIIKIGGSNAQRDMFHQMLTISALRSDSLEHKKIGLSLLNERLSYKPNSNLNKRLARRFATFHLDEINN